MFFSFLLKTDIMKNLLLFIWIEAVYYYGFMQIIKFLAGFFHDVWSLWLSCDSENDELFLFSEPDLLGLNIFCVGQ